MGRVPHFWREAFLSAIGETDPNKWMGRVEYAINALERRYADWGSDPGTPAELHAIQEAIRSLERLMEERLGKLGSTSQGTTQQITPPTGHGVATELKEVRRLFFVLRS